MRTGQDDIDKQGIVRNGFDYNLQIWIKDYICQDVGSNRARYAGQDIRNIKEAR